MSIGCRAGLATIAVARSGAVLGWGSSTVGSMKTNRCFMEDVTSRDVNNVWTFSDTRLTPHSNRTRIH